MRGMEADATGAPITVPVGENTLGRMFNVLGMPIDNKPEPTEVSYEPIHRPAPEFSEQSTQTELSDSVISWYKSFPSRVRSPTPVNTE